MGKTRTPKCRGYLLCCQQQKQWRRRIRVSMLAYVRVALRAIEWSTGMSTAAYVLGGNRSALSYPLASAAQTTRNLQPNMALSAYNIAKRATQAPITLATKTV